MTSAQVNYIIEHGEKLTMQQMADAVGLSYYVVRSICKHYSVQPNKGWFQDGTVEIPPFVETFEKMVTRRANYEYQEPKKEYTRPKAVYSNPSREDIINKYLSMDI